MSIQVEKLEREFVMDGRVVPDPDPSMSVEQVREMYIPTHPEITTATVTGPETVGNPCGADSDRSPARPNAK